MASPHCLSHTAQVATRSEDVSKLSSEVQKLHLQLLNLPITGSKVQLLAQLKRASTGKASQCIWRPGQPQCIRPTANKTSTQQPSTAASGINATQGQRLSIPEDSALSHRASLSSIEDMLKSDAEEDLFHTNQSTNRRDALSSAQRSAIEDTVSQSVHSALHAVRTNSAFSPTPSSQLSQLQVWCLLWVFQGQWTVMWRTKYSRKTVSFSGGVLWLQWVLWVPVMKLQLPTCVPPLPLQQPHRPRLPSATIQWPSLECGSLQT